MYLPPPRSVHLAKNKTCVLSLRTELMSSLTRRLPPRLPPTLLKPPFSEKNGGERSLRCLCCLGSCHLPRLAHIPGSRVCQAAMSAFKTTSKHLNSSYPSADVYCRGADREQYTTGPLDKPAAGKSSNCFVPPRHQPTAPVPTNFGTFVPPDPSVPAGLPLVRGLQQVGLPSQDHRQRMRWSSPMMRGPMGCQMMRIWVWQRV